MSPNWRNLLGGSCGHQNVKLFLGLQLLKRGFFFLEFFFKKIELGLHVYSACSYMLPKSSRITNFLIVLLVL